MGDPFFSFHTIGGDTPYMTRLIIGRLRLHIFHRGDGDPDPHDHPWAFWTLPLTPYVEEVRAQGLAEWPKPGDVWRIERHDYEGTLVYQRIVPAWRLHHRKAEHMHRVLGRWTGKDWDVAPGRIVTLVWRGRGERRWGFLKTRDGRTCWQHWKDYILRGGKHAPCEPTPSIPPDGRSVPSVSGRAGK